MFGEFELEPYPSGLYFPPADEEVWLAFQATLARQRSRDSQAHIVSRKGVPVLPSSGKPDKLRTNRGPSRIVTPAYP